MRRILLDADTLMEFVINRSMFQEKVAGLLEIMKIDGVEVYLSDFGLDKINNITRIMNGQKASKEMCSAIKEQFKILKTTKSIIEEARLLAVADFNSCVEIALAINSNISAIITHEISKFSGSELNVCSLFDFQEREKLEGIFAKETRDRPMFLLIEEQVANLNYLFTLPGDTNGESLKREELHQKLVNSHNFSALSPNPIQDSSLSKYSELIKSSILARNKELMNSTSAAFASRKSIADSFGEKVRSPNRLIHNS